MTCEPAWACVGRVSFRLRSAALSAVRGEGAPGREPPVSGKGGPEDAPRTQRMSPTGRGDPQGSCVRLSADVKAGKEQPILATRSEGR